MDFVNSAPGGGGSRTASGPSADGPGSRGQLDHSTVSDSKILQITLIFYKVTMWSLWGNTGMARC